MVLAGLLPRDANNVRRGCVIACPHQPVTRKQKGFEITIKVMNLGRFAYSGEEAFGIDMHTL